MRNLLADVVPAERVRGWVYHREFAIISAPLDSRDDGSLHVIRDGYLNDVSEIEVK